MPPALRLLALAAGLTGAVVTGAVVVAGPGEEPADDDPPAAATIPLAELDTAGLVVRRESFCEGIADETVTEVLGAAPATGTTYGNGERTRVASGVEDVAHEFGCAWQAGGGSTATAWVFAPPVTPERAAELAAAAPARKGCTPSAGAPPFGSPSAAATCTRGDVVEASWHGLFGDAWLSCSLTLPATTPPAELADRAGRWCAAVATAAS